MNPAPIEEVAMLPELGAVIGFGRRWMVLAANNFRRPPRFVRVHLAILLREQPVAFDC
jgi:hypothetical protein